MIFVIFFVIGLTWVLVYERFDWVVLGMGVVWGAILGAIATGFGSLMFYHSFNTEVPVDRPLAVLVDGKSGTHGSFFLGIGSVSSGNPQYSYYSQNAKGGYELHSIDPDDASVYPDNSAKPFLREYCKKDAMPKWILYPVGQSRKVRCDDYIDEMEFHVPAGSIKSNYTLDAQ